MPPLLDRSQLDPPQLETLCRLARLRLPADGGELLTRRLGGVVRAFADLAAVDTRAADTGAADRVAAGQPADVPPVAAAVDPAMHLRADIPGAVLELATVLGNSTHTAADCFVVPRVVEG